MDAMTLLFGLAVLAGPVVLVVEAALALWRPTRYFGVALALGVIAGVLAIALGPKGAPLQLFLGGFTIAAGPAGVVCAVVAAIRALDRRSAKAVPIAFLAAAAVVGVAAVILAIDEPTGPGTALSGEVKNISVVRRDSGPSRQVVTVALADGRHVQAVVSPAIQVRAGQDVRLQEYRRLVTRRRTYEVIGATQ